MGQKPSSRQMYSSSIVCSLRTADVLVLVIIAAGLVYLRVDSGMARGYQSVPRAGKGLGIRLSQFDNDQVASYVGGGSIAIARCFLQQPVDYCNKLKRNIFTVFEYRGRLEPSQRVNCLKVGVAVERQATGDRFVKDDPQ